MPTSFSIFLLLLLLLLLLVASSTAITEDEEEISILLSLSSHLENTQKEDVFFLTWNSTTPKCNFTGVTCNSLFSVTEIDISHKSLVGTLPLDKICLLPSLQKLSIGFNSLHGYLSPHLNNCTNLNYLDLGNNLFSGEFPTFSSLSQLTHLYLNLSGFTGHFPWHSLSNTTLLKTLSLGDNSFNPSPFPTLLLPLTSLTWLYLSNCSLHGPLPSSLGNLSSLVDLELADNTFSGDIPPSISLLHHLWQLELYDNSFTGEIPPRFGNLSALQFFDASNNLLTGDLSQLSTLTNLVSLQLFQNSFSGIVPPEFGRFKQLVNLSLYMNNLTGSLPQDLGSWAPFNFIDVSENKLTGEIPPDMCKQGTMQKLLMIENRLTGSIPSTYSNCTSLYRFRVKNNLLTGVLPPEILSLPKMALLDFRINRIHGSITPAIAGAAALAQLLASDNLLSGEIPPEISKATSLVTIDLDNNLLSGRIPYTIGELKSLSRLHLQKNRFSGVIPDSLGSCTSLEDMNLAVNSISGEIPPSLAALPSLNSLNISRNALSGGIPAGLAFLGLSLLDLSTNKLTGPIPKGLHIEAYNGSFDSNPGLCSPTVSSFMRCPSDPSSKTSISYHAIVAALVIALLSLVLILGCFIRSRRRRNGGVAEEGGRSLSGEKWDLKSFQVLSFTEGMIVEGIKEGNLIGKGGSGNVYRVEVGGGKELAVKHIWHGVGGGGGIKRWKEFHAEVEALSSVRHVNVVKLYCSICSSGSSLLVYELMQNGSLWERLHSCEKKMALEWESRYEIAMGAAKGLEYLHHGCERAVIHRDVKSSNILLDQFLKPRIADFGLAMMGPPQNYRDSTRVIAGTPGYFAPEYGYTWKVNEKCDVYSFGVVLMELVTGKKPVEAEEYGENEDIVKWVCNKFGKKDTALEAVDEVIVGDTYREDAVKVMRIAILCTARLPEHRPTMRAVVKMLEEADPSRLLPPLFPKPVLPSPSPHVNLPLNNS